MGKPLKMLSIGHSYSVGLNRRLAHEMELAGDGRWEVTVVAPSFMHGDLRPIPLESFPGEACRVKPMPARLSRYIHFMYYSAELRDILKKDWDLVHCWEEPFIVAGGQIAWWTPQHTPLVFATAQNLSKNYPIPFNWIERYCLHRASGWIACGKLVQDALNRNREFYSARASRIIPQGVDTSHFQPDPEARRRTRERLGWSLDGPLVIGYMGRFVPQKGLKLLTNALDALSIPWRALFLGGGPMTRELQEWGARFGDSVKVITGADHNDVPSYLNAMDIMCAPSQTTSRWHEQFGRMTIEAFACGVPFIGSSSGEIPNVVGDAGMIVAEGEDQEWLKAIEQLMQDPQRRAELSEKGVQRAKRFFCWKVVARQHLEFFEELIDARYEGVRTMQPQIETIA
jgi:glycosyltransferase involved in cell wall biosynthesis